MPYWLAGASPCPRWISPIRPHSVRRLGCMVPWSSATPLTSPRPGASSSTMSAHHPLLLRCHGDTGCRPWFCSSSTSPSPPRLRRRCVLLSYVGASYSPSVSHQQAVSPLCLHRFHQLSSCACSTSLVHIPFFSVFPRFYLSQFLACFFCCALVRSWPLCLPLGFMVGLCVVSLFFCH